MSQHTAFRADEETVIELDARPTHGSFGDVDALMPSAPEPKDIYIQTPLGFRLDNCDILNDRHIRLRRHGRRTAPPVLVMGGMAHDRRLAGADGWWSQIVGWGGALDLNRNCALGLDFAPLADEDVVLSPKAQARLIAHALDRLDIECLPAIVAASYGAMVALTFAAQYPSRVQRLCIIQGAHRPSAMALAWRGVQRRVVQFGLAHNDGERALELARQLDHANNRGAAEFSGRLNCIVGQDGVSDLDRHLIAQARNTEETMSPRRWLSLSASMDRAMVAPELITARTTIIACPTDQVVAFGDIQELITRLRHFTALHMLQSVHGHDAFLEEPDRLGPIIEAFMAGARDV